MLNAAVEDGVILANPAGKLGRALRLAPSKAARQEEVKAFTREQLDAFLSAAWAEQRRLAPLFFLMGRSGLRVGEALAVQWDDLDLRGAELRVARAVSDNGQQIDTPKSGHGRTVDLSGQVVDVLRRLDAERKAEALRRGWREVPAWAFCSETGGLLDPHNVRRAFRKTLEAAGLPGHFTPHCLRHTYASLLLVAGVSIYYVQRQLGHASIQLTVDTYGKWLPAGNKAAVNLLDGASGSSGSRLAACGGAAAPPADPSGSKVVAAGGSGAKKPAQLVDVPSGPREIRTPDPLIKSPAPFGNTATL